MKLLQENTIIMTVQVNEMDGSIWNDYTGGCEVFHFDVTTDEEIMENKNNEEKLVYLIQKYFKESIFYQEYADLKLWEYEIKFSIFN